MKRDSTLQGEVQAELGWEPSLEAAHIGVSADGGVVTLTGHVDSYRDKLMAEKAAKRVMGVRALANDLRVKLPGSMVRDDTEIAEAASSSLRWNTAVPDQNIRVIVSDGVLVLEGEVDRDDQRRAAAHAVRDLVGVVAVVNRIRLRPSARAEGIKEKIEEAFERSARLDARRVLVDCSGGTVTLRGSVASWAEHDEASDAAWSAAGVTRVDNLLNVGSIDRLLYETSHGDSSSHRFHGTATLRRKVDSNAMPNRPS